VGINMGKISELEERGRVLIPKSFREELQLKPKQKLIVERRGGEIVLRPSIDLKKFSLELKGCVKKSKVKPEEIKKIWKS
jgi:AbrB family looped-hinge helix DNA binding protein